MPEFESWPRHFLFKSLQQSIAHMGGSIELAPRQAFALGSKKARLPMAALPIRLTLGRSKRSLQLVPETAFSDSGELRPTGNLLVLDMASDPGGARAFVRLVPGQVITVGRDSPEQEVMFGLDEQVAGRHLTIKVFDDELLLKNHQPDMPVKVTPLDSETLERHVDRRLQAMSHLRDLLCVPPARILEPEPALALLEEVLELLEREAHRPTDRRGMPGGLVSLPDKLEPVIVGDLHARIDNLLVVLSRGGVLDALESGRACLLILGDAVHREEGDLEEMDSSLAMMDCILRLKRRFPDQVFYLRGNHDSLSDDLEKKGVPQGALWRRHLKRVRGKKYRKAMQRFYDLLPYVACSRRFLACHAGAPMTKVDRDMLVNIRQYPGLERELTESGEGLPARQRAYGRSEVTRFRKGMGLAPDAPVISGHTPLSDDDTLWMNAGDITDHHIVYSGGSRWVGAMTRVGDWMVPLRYPTEPLAAIADELPE